MLLFDTFLQRYEQVYASVSRDPIARSGQQALIQALRQGEKLYFEQSTMAMLREKLAHYQETLEEVKQLVQLPTIEEMLSLTGTMFHRGTWIEFPKPIKSGEAFICALFCYVPSTYLSTGKECYMLYLIGQNADIHEILTSQPGEIWEFEPLTHRCPVCTHSGSGPNHTILPCHQCEQMILVWAHIFALASIIAAQYLAAIRYEERTFTHIRHVKREHSQKMRRVPVKHVFKVIDANEILVMRPAQEEHEGKGEIRGSWLEDARGVGDLDYHQITTRPFTRRYHTLEGIKEVLFASGVERVQPIRKSIQEKRIIKVKASQYE